MTTPTQRFFGAAREGRLISGLARRLARPWEGIMDWAFADELTRLANRYGSDKGNRVFARHYYTRIYHQLLAHLRPFDIVIDDASHASTHQQIALACLFPHVTLGGFYFIEDLNRQPMALERPDVPQTRTLLRRKCFESPVVTSAEAKLLAANVESIQLFDTRDIFNLDKSDALGLLRRKAIAPVHTSS